MRVRILIAAVCILTAFASAHPEPGFDPREVVRRVRQPETGSGTQGFDSGEFLIDTSGVHAEAVPAVAFDGTNFLVVWADERSGDTSDIYGARVTPQGTVLDPQGFVILQAASSQWYPALRFDGANFLVVWQDYRSGSDPDIYGARVTPQGTVLDPQGFVISQAAISTWPPALGFDGANFLVVWADYRGSDPDIYGARVTPQGTVLDPSGFVISQAADYQYGPALAFDGANFLVAWADERGGDTSDIYGARVTPQGTVLDPQGFVISQAADFQQDPALGFDGANFLVVWLDYRSRGDIYGARVTPGGVVLNPSGIAVSTAAYDPESPSVAFDGANFLAVWGDSRNDSSDIYGARVSPAGTVLDEFPVVTQERNQRYPALVRGPGSHMFLVYQGWAGTVGGKTYNVYRTWGKMDPVPGIEEKENSEVRRAKSGATIVRGVLLLPASGVRHQASSVLLDISGRQVFDLHPGANDLRALPGGLFFLRTGQSRTDKVLVVR